MSSFLAESECCDLIPFRLIAIVSTFVIISMMVLLMGCSRQYEVYGKYYSTSQDGVQVCIEFENKQLRICSDYNNGPWRDYKRDENTITATGISMSGSKEVLTIEILSDKCIEVKDFVGDQDVQFRKH